MVEKIFNFLTFKTPHSTLRHLAARSNMFHHNPRQSESKNEKDESSALFSESIEIILEKSLGSLKMPLVTSGTSAGKVDKGSAPQIIEESKSQNKDALSDPVPERMHHSKMKQTTALNLKAASMKLYRLMTQDATERRIPGRIESPGFDVDFKKIDSIAQGIGTAIRNYMDQWSELKASRGQVKVLAEKWFNASYPVIKKRLDVAAVCLRAWLTRSSGSRSSPVWTGGYRDGVPRKGNSGP